MRESAGVSGDILLRMRDLVKIWVDDNGSV